MKIKRAVKCAAVKEQLKEILEIAEKTDIRGLEIQEIFPLIQDCSFKERGEIITGVFKNYPLTSLVYHQPLNPLWNDISEAEKFDLAAEKGSYILIYIEETIKEAAFVGKALDVKTEIPIVVHLFGFAKLNEITPESRIKKLKSGEKKLLELKKIADYYSKKSGLKLVIVRENNPPDHGKVLGLLDFHPKDIIRTENLGIGTNLDISHLWQTILYYKNGKGELTGVDLAKKFYPNIDLEEVINLVKPSLRLVHLNDAGPGYQKKFEGLEIGKGTLPHSKIIPLLCSNLEKDVIGTYEIKYGHKDQDSILRSDQFYRKLFKEKFNNYFE